MAKGARHPQIVLKTATAPNAEGGNSRLKIGAVMNVTAMVTPRPVAICRMPLDRDGEPTLSMTLAATAFTQEGFVGFAYMLQRLPWRPHLWVVLQLASRR